MEKKLYLHIGYPRTATKTLQLYLFKKHTDINYLGRFPNRKISHNRLIIKILNYDNKEFESNFDKLVNETKNLPIDISKTNLISDEFFLLNDFLYNRITIENSIERISRLCKSSEIELKILFSVRNQTDIIKSIFSVTFLTSLNTNCTKIIDLISKKKTDTYTHNFVSSLNYQGLYQKISKFLDKDNIKFVFFEDLQINPTNYFEQISNILNIDYDQSLKLTKNLHAHEMNDQISNDPRLSTKYQMFIYKVRKFRLRSTLEPNFLLKISNFFKKVFLKSSTKKKDVYKNRDQLEAGLMILNKNEKKIKNYFNETNKKFFNIKKTNLALIKYYF